MNYINLHINRSALVAQFVLNCPSAQLLRPEITGALRVAYGSNLIATDINGVDT